MVQFVKSEMRKVKLEEDDDGFVSLPKRLRLDCSHKWSSDDDLVSTPPTLSDPMNGTTSPLGLRLRKSPSLLDLIQMRLSKEETNKEDSNKGTLDTKLKASNFPASILRIGTWEYKSRHEGDLVAKCYFAKHKLVWEVLDGCLKSKIEIPWSDIMALKANYPQDGPGTLLVVLARRPLFFKEINPQPRKHTLWQTTSDFTGGQASIQRQHFLQCPQGFLGKHFEKLIQCDHRLNFLSQQPNMVLDCPYFEPRNGYGLDRTNEDQAGFFGLQDVDSVSAVQSSSPIIEHSLLGIAAGKDSHYTSPSSDNDSHATKEFWSRGANTPNFHSDLTRIKVTASHPSTSMTDLVSQIDHHISEQITYNNSISVTNNYLNKRSSVLKEITQDLFGDSKLLVAPPDEQFLMSRVNSLCCLLQRDPSTTQNTRNKGKIVEMNSNLASLSVSPCEFNNSQLDDDDASGIHRKELGGELLNLPRIASFPQFLFLKPDDSFRQVRW